MAEMVTCENLVKIYKTRETEVVALQGLDLTVQAGEMMAIIGSSGSGKSTLLNMIGALDRPSAGVLRVGGYDLLKMTDQQRVTYRREVTGFVWQNNARNLIPYLTALENVQVPMHITGAADKQARAMELLELVGLEKRAGNRPSQLSGGEQQRVAIAIALANRAPLLLADEPTGAVDTRTADQILDILRRARDTLGTTVVIVTHDRSLSRKVDRIVEIRDGRTATEYLRRSDAPPAAWGREAEAAETDTHVQLAVVDAVGRLQLPAESLAELGIDGRTGMQVQVEAGRIVLTPHREG